MTASISSVKAPLADVYRRGDLGMTWFWATVTGILVGGMLGVLFGLLGWARRWCLAVVALLGVATALAVSTVRGDSPNWLWWSLSVILAMAACTLAWHLARGNVPLQTWVAVVGVVILVGGVATAGYHAGTTVARATTTTPHDPGNAAGIDPADCSQASLSAARPSKPYRWIALGDSYSAGVG